MKRMGVWVALLGMALSVSSWAWGAAAPPRFRFTAGEVLTYEISAAITAGDEGGSFDMSLQGIAELKVLRVAPSGNVEIQVTSHGEGGAALTLTGAGQQFSDSRNMDDSPIPPVVLVVKPDGTIISAKAPSGKRVTRFTSWGPGAGGSGIVQAVVFSDYALFDLLLPKALPPVGKTWKGFYKVEIPQLPDLEGMSQEEIAAIDVTTLKVKTQQIPVTFVYHGVKKYQGRSCLAITSKPKGTKEVPQLGLFPTIYFDAEKGQLVGMELHASETGSKIDITMRLISGEKGSASSSDASAKPAPKPSSETPASSGSSGSDDDFVPVVK